MIESFEVETKVGNPTQVGLFFKSELIDSSLFLNELRTSGYILSRVMTSNRRGYNQFIYIGPVEKGSSKEALRNKLDVFCKTQMLKTEITDSTITYELWRNNFNQHLRDYRNQRFDHTADNRRDAFNKGQAYNLIQARRFQEAERYLKDFLNGDIPLLVPDYLVFLYESWGKSNDVVAIFETHRKHFYSNEVDHSVIEWVVNAFLRISPQKSEQALGILDDFLPEFQRQGVAEKLLAYRTQARLTQGKLPQTLDEMRRFIENTSSERLLEQLDALLDVVTTFVDPLPNISELFSQMEAKVAPKSVWKIDKARADLAQRDNNPEDAIQALQTALGRSDLDEDVLQSYPFRLNIAHIRLDMGQPAKALTETDALQVSRLGSEDQRIFWRIRGQAELICGSQENALNALSQAYDLGERTPQVLQSLGQLAYQAEDLTLARQVYSSLLQSGFQPVMEDLIYSGILNWLDGDLGQAKKQLEKVFSESSWEQIPAQLRILACQAYAESLKDLRAESKDLIPVYNAWIDALTESQERLKARQLAEQLIAGGLEHESLFSLVEALEPLISETEKGKQLLGEVYAQWLITEIDHAIRQRAQLAGWVLDLRLALFEMDRPQFSFVQEYLQSELTQARQAQLVSGDFNPESEKNLRTSINLKGRSIALIGGYEPMRRRVREVLVGQFGLSRFTEVPPSWEAHVDQDKVAEAVRGADLIVVVHRCIKHDGTDTLKAAIEGTELDQNIRYAAGKGQSSIIRVVKEYFPT